MHHDRDILEVYHPVLLTNIRDLEEKDHGVGLSA